MWLGEALFRMVKKFFHSGSAPSPFRSGRQSRRFTAISGDAPCGPPADVNTGSLQVVRRPGYREG